MQHDDFSPLILKMLLFVYLLFNPTMIVTTILSMLTIVPIIPIILSQNSLGAIIPIGINVKKLSTIIDWHKADIIFTSKRFIYEFKNSDKINTNINHIDSQQ